MTFAMATNLIVTIAARVFAKVASFIMRMNAFSQFATAKDPRCRSLAFEKNVAMILLRAIGRHGSLRAVVR
jgi:hypothetical protein